MNGITPKTPLVFDFVEYGQVVETKTEKGDVLYLDVGNDLRPGVIDHHHLLAFNGSAASLVLAHPELTTGAVNPEREEEDPFTIVVHVNPDLDCLASAYLAWTYLLTETFPAGAVPLSKYADRVDAGYMGLNQENPFSLYSAWMQLYHRLGSYSWESKREFWRECLRSGVLAVEYVMKKVAEGKSILEVDAFTCPGLFGPRDRQDVEQDLARYRAKLVNPDTRARKVTLSIPSLFGGGQPVDALLVRNVQSIGDPERCLFFKDWARTDKRNSPSGDGFAALSVFEEESSEHPRRCIISVKPDCGVSLRGLGETLDRAEAEERARLFGMDDRVQDPGTGSPIPPRPGYTNSDPWYDGRGHGYTIIDAPRSGTRLSADQIEEILIHFGSRKDEDLTSLDLESMEKEAESSGNNEASFSQISILLDTYQQQSAGEPEKEQYPEIFISYPRKKQAWVVEYIYEPLKAWRGEKNIFFDQRTLDGGAGWLARLAEGVTHCSVFVAVYCKYYFMSPFCEWELQLAITRDPIGRKRIVVPVMIEPVNLPGYCSLIQAIDATSGDFLPELFQVMEKTIAKHNI